MTDQPNDEDLDSVFNIQTDYSFGEIDEKQENLLFRNNKYLGELKQSWAWESGNEAGLFALFFPRNVRNTLRNWTAHEMQ